MKILVSGSSGFIGSGLVHFLKEKGHVIFKLVRHSTNLSPNEIAWDLHRGIVDLASLEGFDAVVHLAGENLSSGRWTEEKKRRIFESRVHGSELLSRALASLKHPPAVLVAASAVGYYGNRGGEILTEKSLKGTGFLSDVCAAWEAATSTAAEKGIRVVHLRQGVVLSVSGGMLKKLLLPFKLGLGAVMGTGEQYMSWIALEDLLEVIQATIQMDSLKGAVNAVSPHPVTNQEFTIALGQALRRPNWLRVPFGMAKLIFGEMADELLLSSTRVEPQILMQSGFHFSQATLEQALTRHSLY